MSWFSFLRIGVLLLFVVAYYQYSVMINCTLIKTSFHVAYKIILPHNQAYQTVVHDSPLLCFTYHSCYG